MGHIFQVECWEKIIVGITCCLIMTMEIGKGIGKAKEATNGNLIMNIKEIREKEGKETQICMQGKLEEK